MDRYKTLILDDRRLHYGENEHRGEVQLAHNIREALENLTEYEPIDFYYFLSYNDHEYGPYPTCAVTCKTINTL